MKSVALFSDDTELRDLVNQLEDYTVAYFSTEFDPKKLPKDIDLAIFDFDVVPLSLLDQWSQFPRLHLPKLVVVSAEILDKVDDILHQLDNYVVRPFLSDQLLFRINQVFGETNAVNEFNILVKYEVQNPILSIKGYASLILDSDREFSRKDILDFVNTIENNAKRTQELIHLSQFWWQVEYRKTYDFAPLDVKKITEKVTQDVEKCLAKKSQSFKLWIPDNLPSVYGDEFGIPFVLDALLDNASKYSDEKTEIQVAFTSEHGFLVCIVKDSGFGISKNSKDRIFEKFYRGDLPVVHIQQGVGLSLYLCKQIIEMHGGKIWFESEEGVGTIFYFTLPLAE